VAYPRQQPGSGTPRRPNHMLSDDAGSSSEGLLPLGLAAPVSAGTAGGGGVHRSQQQDDSDDARLASQLPAGEPAPAPAGSVGHNVWVAVPMPAGSGQSYYFYHAVSRETRWEAPEGEDVVIVAQNDLEALAGVAGTSP
jgi:hypothetical protein